MDVFWASMKDPAPRVLYVKDVVNMKDTGPYKAQTFW